MAVDRVLTIPRSIESLYFPLKSSIDLKYTSVAVSSSIICLGTNTGSTYIFEKESLKLVKFIASKGGSVDILQFSKDERLLAIVDSTGLVTCLEVKEEKYEIKVAKEIEDHKGARVTSLTWDDDSARLFIGDERGIVTAVIIAPFKLPAGKFLSKSTVEIVVKGESPVVQLDYSKLRLLVSTTTRTLLCLTDRSKYQQVGSKPRDGKYGSCFIQYEDKEYPVVYAARPGSRIWEVDFQGEVLATHQFKNLLATAPTRTRGLTKGRSFVSNKFWDKPQSVAFPRLNPFCYKYLVTWSSYALYILNVSLGEIAGWYDEIKGVRDVSCKNESIFVVDHDGKVFEFEFMTVKSCLNCLISLAEYRQAAEVAVKHREDILRQVESFLTVDFEAVKEVLANSDDADLKELRKALGDLTTQLQLKHNQIRAEIQERLNDLPNVDDSTTPCDSGVEDNDEVRSNQSEVVSETSSRISLTRLSHVDVDRVLRRATNAVFNKILSSGFVKRALSEDTGDSKQRPASPLLTSPSQTLNASSASNETIAVPRAADREENATNEMGNVELRSLDQAEDGDVTSRSMPLGKKPNGKRRRKAKVVTVDFETPEKDDIFKATSYETPGKARVRRILSSDSANPYIPNPDMKRLGSLPHNVNKLDSVDQTVTTLVDTVDSQSQFNHANIIEKARQLVRKVIYTETPSPLDVQRTVDITTRGATSQNKLTCLLVSETAMQSLPKFVDVTAVCRNKLRDSRVLFNSKTVKKILQDWAEKLAETVKDFSIAMANDIEKKNKKHKFTNEETLLLLIRTREEFFSNLGAAFSEVSSLAVLCFEAGIFPASCWDLSSLEKCLIESDATLSKFRQDVNEILNKDDNEGMKNDTKATSTDNDENEAPQESLPATLLVLSQSHDETDESYTTDNCTTDGEITNDASLDSSSEFLGTETTSKENSQLGSNLEEATIEKSRENLRENHVRETDPTTLAAVDVTPNSFSEDSSVASRAHEGGVSEDVVSTKNRNLEADKGVVERPKTLNWNALRYLQVKSDMNNCVNCSQSVARSKITTGNRVARVPSSTLRDYVDVEVPKETCFLHQNIEAILCTSDDPKTCQSCREDMCRACFVLRFFPLLDLNKIRTVLGWKQGCRWRTWLAYLIHLEDGTLSQELNQAIANDKIGKTSRLLHDSPSLELFFSCVRRLLPSSSSLVFDLCTEKEVYPWEVCFIYMVNFAEVDCLNNFLHYVTTMRRIKPNVTLMEDTSVAMTILYCSLKSSSNSGNIKSYYCDCGAAREGAHLLPWQHKEFIDDVISAMVGRDPNCGRVNRVFDFCRRYGYWYGCIRILRLLKEHKQAFELICQLGDFRLIDDYVRAEAFCISDSDLKHLCSLKYHKRSTEVNCQPAVPGFTPSINSESLARLLVKELGPVQALEILKSFDEGAFVVSSGFYYDCMKIAEIEVQQSLVVRKMVEALSNEVCFENKAMFQRNIEQLKNKELSDGLPSQVFPDKDDVASEDLKSSASSNHWGVQLSLSSSDCPCCTLPLCVPGASSSAGLIIFDCGHTYHKHCLPEEACLICFYKLDPAFN